MKKFQDVRKKVGQRRSIFYVDLYPKTKMGGENEVVWTDLMHLKEKPSREKTIEEKKLKIFRKEIEGEFLFPEYYKMVTWGLALTWVSICWTVLNAYGRSHDDTSIYQWITISIVSFIIMFLLVQPTGILILAVILNYVYEFNIELSCKQMSPEIFSKTHNTDNYAEVAELREKNSCCYQQQQPEVMQKRKAEILQLMKTHLVLEDWVIYITLFVVFYVKVYSNDTDDGFYSNQVVRHLVDTAGYTRSIPLMRVHTYGQFLEYMNETLIPALLKNKNMNSSSPEDAVKAPLLPDQGWSKDSQIKLVTTLRLRQKRAYPEICSINTLETHEVKESIKCPSTFSFWNEDTSDYGMAWDNLLPGEGMLDDSELLPWRYRNWWENRVWTWHGHSRFLQLYGGGGYVINFGKSATEAMKTLEFMDYFNWIDGRTRVIFLELTTYSAGADLYNVVTIMFEVSATGVFSPSYKVYTNRLFLPEDYKYYFSISIFLLFALLVLSLMKREFGTILKVGVLKYISEGWKVLDLLLVIFGLCSIITTVCAMIYKYLLEKELNSAASNNFISYEYFAYWNSYLVTFDAICIAIVTAKGFHHLAILTAFYRYGQILREAWTALLGLAAFILIPVFIFSIYSFITIGRETEKLHTLWQALPAMIASTKRTETSYIENMANIPGVIIFVVFYVFCSFIILGIYRSKLMMHINSVPMTIGLPFKEYLKSKIWKDVIIPQPERDEEKSVRLRFPMTSLPYIDEVRLQGLKRVTLQILTGKDYTDIAALNIAHIVLTGNANRPGTDKCYVVESGMGHVVVEEKRMSAMKDEAERVLRYHNI